ncbi:hypothetical protein FJN13_12765 [Alteromonas mediterranea]|uniref:hypothetical protein n=1 Tax=Alteromonas mediterranea TaxID=314275 RepID=UPI001131D3DD|nr:hypothetical protein [Alteromonas mediterranea]QDG35612.1 hypothetical protein FJN13_12765 [Alteromonas mediterranea]
MQQKFETEAGLANGVEVINHKVGFNDGVGRLDKNAKNDGSRCTCVDVIKYTVFLSHNIAV